MGGPPGGGRSGGSSDSDGERPEPGQALARLVIFHEEDEFNVTDAQDVMQTVYDRED